MVIHTCINETSATPQQIITRIALYGSVRTPGNKRPRGYPHVCLCIQKSSGASIAAHPARCVHSQKRKYVRVAEDGLALRVWPFQVSTSMLGTVTYSHRLETPLLLLLILI